MLLGSHRYRTRPYTRMFPAPGGRPCPHKSSDLTWPSQATQEHNLHFGLLPSTVLGSDLQNGNSTHTDTSAHKHHRSLVCTAVFTGKVSYDQEHRQIFLCQGRDQQAMRLTEVSRTVESGLCDWLFGRPELSATRTQERTTIATLSIFV